MNYEVTIRHTEHRGDRDGNVEVTCLGTMTMEAKDEEDLLRRIRFDGIWDGVSAIKSLGKGGIMPFSVDTGHSEFPSNNLMPQMAHEMRARSDFEARLG